MKDYEHTDEKTLKKDSKSEWMGHLAEDTIIKPNGSQLRFEDDMGRFTLTPVILKERVYDHNSLHDPELYDGFSGYNLSNSSSRSFLSKPRKDTLAQRRVGLVLVLLIGALLISFGVGLLVHYWLMQEGKNLQQDLYSATLSVPILNQTFTKELQNTTSAEFKAIALPFCGELDSFFENSRLAPEYHGCSVKSIREEGNPRNCKCSGVVSVADSALNLDIDLALTDASKQSEILDILRENAMKVDFAGLKLAFIRNFLVEIANVDNECLHPDTCQNGGLCLTNVQSFTCICADGWTGTKCTRDENECVFYPCLNDGTCSNTPGSYQCACTDGWTGEDCGTDRNECEDVPCLNGGSCSNTNGSYTCSCSAGWTGRNCELDMNECTLYRPCVHGACLNSLGSYQCICPSSWTGFHCETNVNECETYPCMNGASCDDFDGGFTCNCSKGWIGPTCNVDVDECYFSPCQHGGTCHNTAGTYTCRCSPGWYGINCETNWDECSLYPCVNNSTCVDTVGSFQCRCEDGWTGQTCSDNIDECLRNPCMNGATCQDTEGSYTCLCPTDFTGQDCENDVAVFFRYSSKILNMTYEDNMGDKFSLEFQKYSKPFIFQATITMLENPAKFASFKEVTVTSFRDNPFSIDWEIHFYGNVSYSKRSEALDHIMTANPSVIFKNTIGTKIGDLLIFLDNYTETTVSLGLRVLNLTLTPEIMDTNSIVFRWYANAVCNDLTIKLKEDLLAFPTYRTCEMLSFSKNDPVRMNLSLTFEGDLPVEKLRTDLLQYLVTSSQLLPYQFYMTYILGTLLIHHQDIETQVDMTFKVLNLTWSSNLIDENSDEFKRHAQLFASDVSTILGSSSAYYSFESVDKVYFGNDPINITTVMTFLGDHSEDALVKNSSDVIFQNTPQFSYQGKIVNLIGDLLVYFSDWDVIVHDAWLSNMTLYIHDFLYENDLSIPSSALFQQFQKEFCTDINRFMTASSYNDRYYRCFVEQIGQSDPATLTFKMLFNGTTEIPDADLKAVLNNSAQHINVIGRDTMFIGRNIYTFGDLQRLAVNISDYTTTTLPTTTETIVHILVNVSFSVLNLNYTKELADPTSQEFQNIATPFCDFLDKLYGSRFPDQSYEGCQINYFTTNPDRVHFELNFRGKEDPTIQKTIFMALVENAPRKDVSNQIAIMIGPLAIFEQSLITGG